MFSESPFELEKQNRLPHREGICSASLTEGSVSMRREQQAHQPAAAQTRSDRQYPIFAAFFIGLCLLVGILLFWFYGQLQSTIRDESNGYLKEVATRVGSNVQRIIVDTYSMLSSFTNTLEQSDADTFTQFKAIAERDQSYWGYEEIYLIDGGGNAYNVDGKPFALTGDVYLREVVMENKNSMSPLQMVDGKECVIFAVPMEGRSFDGIAMEALAVTYAAENFAQILSMSSFNEQAYSHIVSKDGTLIIRSQSENGTDFGYNVFTVLDQSALMTPELSRRYRSEIQNDQTGQIEFEENGRREYMVYTPVPPDEWYLLTFVPVEVVNAKSNLLLGITLVIFAFITAAFALLALTMLLTFRRHRRRLEHLAYVDDITGGNTIERFYELAQKTLSAPGHPPYALLYSNISKFKVFNETFGNRSGDEMLYRFYQLVAESLHSDESIGRLSADHFCILLRFEDAEKIQSRLEGWYETATQLAAQPQTLWSLPSTEFGVYILENDSMPFPQMIDRAKLALHGAHRSINTKLHYAVYNDEVRAQLFRETQLEGMMEDALRNHEFQMYLQPKFRTSDSTIAGAEALTRWVSASEGMIFPDEFIPLFEKNGFIAKLDLWIFEEACRLIQSLLKENRAIKISVNCSRAHMRDPNLVRSYRRIAEQFKIPPHLLEIELTESFILEDAELFKKVVEEIHSAGFGCSMDDFGSGYSSLNMIQELTVDTIKLDKIFFRSTGLDATRTESVVSNIIRMAKALSMETVAEGIEHQTLVDMLRRAGCDLIQGYVFARPMPVSEFLKQLP